MPDIRVGDTNMLESKNAKICVTPMPNLKFALPPTPNPNASQWNKGCVGSPTQIFVLAMYISLFLGVDFIRVGSRFSVEYGLKRRTRKRR